MMQSETKFAFKEWAVVCAALAGGRQTLILRKGGIHEGREGFRVEHREFWLFPTGFHQQRDEVIPDAWPLLDEVQRREAARRERLTQCASPLTLPGRGAGGEGQSQRESSTTIAPHPYPSPQRGEGETDRATAFVSTTLAQSHELSLYAVVEDVQHVIDRSALSRLSGRHVWSESTVEQRFQYRTPGLFTLIVRIYHRPTPFEIADSPYFAGCKSWLELPLALPTADLQPVLEDATFDRQRREIQQLLAG